MRRFALALIELEFDAAVMGECAVVGPVIDRLEFGESSGGQAVGGDAPFDQISQHRGGPGG